MIIKQLSVFIENRAGRLEKVTETLREHNIAITSLSLADTSEYGMLRMIVSDPKKSKTVLKEAGFSAMLTDVIAVRLAQKNGMLHELLKVLINVNIEYMYALSTGENAAIILKLSELDKGEKALWDGGFEIMGEEAYSINGSD